MQQNIMYIIISYYKCIHAFYSVSFFISFLQTYIIVMLLLVVLHKYLIWFLNSSSTSENSWRAQYIILCIITCLNLFPTRNYQHDDRKHREKKIMKAHQRIFNEICEFHTHGLCFRPFVDLSHAKTLETNKIAFFALKIIVEKMSTMVKLNWNNWIQKLLHYFIYL